MAPKPPNNGSTRTPGSGNFQGVSPVCLSSSCTLSQNNSALPDQGRLSYPYRKAIVIDEIRWTIKGPYTHTDGLNLGALVSTKLALGQKYLNRDYCPIWLFGTVMSLLEEQNADVTVTPFVSYSQYRWRLPQPLYIAAGQYLSSVFSRGADGFSSDFTVRVSYLGHTVAPNQPIPGVIAVPYVAPFVTTLGNTYEQSNENDLFNPFDFPLKIQRLTGRVLQFASGDAAVAVEALTPATAGSAVALQMDDSWGGKMVQNLTGPGDVFDCLRGAWTVDTIMPPKSIYACKVWNIPANQQVHVGMIGYRDEVL